jgi:predicted kinase
VSAAGPERDGDRRAVFVNGIPGSGKTTLVARLAPELGFPVVSKDSIKEALGDLVPGLIPARELGALASDAMWSMAGMIDGPVVIESFWATGRDDEFFHRGVVRAGIRVAVEVWCGVSLETARRRFAERQRHPVHEDETRVFEWEQLARDARPISDFPVIPVNTETVVDVQALSREIRAVLG